MQRHVRGLELFRGSVETFDNTHLMRLAGRFSRRGRAYAKASGIPLIDCRPGDALGWASRHGAGRLAEQVCSSTDQTSSQYGPRRAAYDLRKLRAKNIVNCIGKGRRYEATPNGLKAIAALVVLRNQVIQPLLASAINRMPSRGAQNPTALDQCYASLRTHMQNLLEHLGWQ